jgi:hypothetical protein
MGSNELVLALTMQHPPKEDTPLHVVVWEGNTNIVKGDDIITTKHLLERISLLEKTVAKLIDTNTSSLFFSNTLNPTPRGIDVKSRSNSVMNESDAIDVFKTVSKVSGSPLNTIPGPPPFLRLHWEKWRTTRKLKGPLPTSKLPYGMSDTHTDDEDGDGDCGDDDSNGANENTSITDDIEGLELDEEVEEYTEITWKGVTYFKDSENYVYAQDDDGDLVEQPIGYWKEDTQKLVKYKAPVK